MAFELAISPSSLSINGTCEIFEQKSTDHFDEVTEIPAGKTELPTNTIIQDDQPFLVRFKWQVNGIFAHFLGGGQWKCDVMFEKMGGGETYFNPNGTTNDLGNPGSNYKVDVQIGAGRLSPGVYRVISRIQYYFSNGQPGPLVAFEDKGIIQIYKDL